MTRLATSTGRSTSPRDFPISRRPAALKEAAARAIYDDINQYAITWGAPRLRERDRREVPSAGTAWTVDPEPQVTVTCGATEAMIASMLALLDPGDEVDRLRAVLRELRARRDPGRREARVSCRCTSRTGRSTPTELRGGVHAADSRDHRQHAAQPHRQVFTRDELERSPSSASEHDVLAIHRRDLRAHPLRGRAHPASPRCPGWRERTITITALSKTYQRHGMAGRLGRSRRPR